MHCIARIRALSRPSFFPIEAYLFACSVMIPLGASNGFAVGRSIALADILGTAASRRLRSYVTLSDFDFLCYNDLCSTSRFYVP